MLYVDRAHAVELGEDETFICDLIGCRVIDLQPQLDLCQNASGVGNDPYNPGQGGPWDEDPQ